jgi:hypothetical protein
MEDDRCNVYGQGPASSLQYCLPALPMGRINAYPLLTCKRDSPAQGGIDLGPQDTAPRGPAIPAAGDSTPPGGQLWGAPSAVRIVGAR